MLHQDFQSKMLLQRHTFWEIIIRGEKRVKLIWISQINCFCKLFSLNYCAVRKNRFTPTVFVIFWYFKMSSETYQETIPSGFNWSSIEEMKFALNLLKEDLFCMPPPSLVSINLLWPPGAHAIVLHSNVLYNNIFFCNGGSRETLGGPKQSRSLKKLWFSCLCQPLPPPQLRGFLSFVFLRCSCHVSARARAS